MWNLFQRIGRWIRGTGTLLAAVEIGVAGVAIVAAVVGVGGIGGCASEGDGGGDGHFQIGGTIASDSGAGANVTLKQRTVTLADPADSQESRYDRCVTLVRNYAHETDGPTRAKMLGWIAETRTALAVMVLAHALRDEDPRVLQAAVDGMIAAAGIPVGDGASDAHRLAAAREYWATHESEWTAKATAESDAYKNEARAPQRR